MMDCNMEFTKSTPAILSAINASAMLDVPALRARNEATANTESQSITDGGLDPQREKFNVHYYCLPAALIG